MKSLVGMQFKLQLTNNSGDDPIYWNKFRSYILESVADDYSQSFGDDVELINDGLIEYKAIYVVEDESAYNWNDYILFSSEADHFLFMMKWS